MFYHILGLSNLRKIMWPKLEVLNLTVNSEGGGADDSYARGSSVEQETIDQNQGASRDTLIPKISKEPST